MNTVAVSIAVPPTAAWPVSVPIAGSSVPSCGCVDCPAQGYALRLERHNYAIERRTLPLELLAQGARNYLRGGITRRHLRELVAAVDRGIGQ